MQSDEGPSEAACGAASSRTGHRSPGGPPGHPATQPLSLDQEDHARANSACRDRAGRDLRRFVG